MPAELGLDRVGYAANLKRFDARLEGRDHLAIAEPAEITAVWTGGAGRAFLGKFRKVSVAAGKLCDFFRDLFLGHQNVRGVVFQLWLFLGVAAGVFSLNRIFGEGGVDTLTGVKFRKIAHLLQLQPTFDGSTFLKPGAGRSLAEKDLVDHLVDQPIV